MKFLSLLVICLLIQLQSASSSEVDNFTDRYLPLDDSLSILDQKAEEAFDKALALANKEQGCSEKKLYKNLRIYFRNHVQGKFNRWLAHTHEIPKRPVNNSKSIYQDFKWYEAFTAAIKNIYQDTSADAILINGVQTGTDKFEHFFGRGYAYFSQINSKKKSFNQILKFGHNSEKYLLGSKTTGVYSYGDLAANFHGMRFWNHLLLKSPDVLGAQYNHGPIVVCQDGKWQKNMVDGKFIFSWKNYVDESWDEANNCSAFRTEQLLKKVKNRIEILESKTGLRHTCPVAPDAIKAIKLNMLPYSEWFINSDGHKKL